MTNEIVENQHRSELFILKKELAFAAEPEAFSPHEPGWERGALPLACSNLRSQVRTPRAVAFDGNWSFEIVSASTVNFAPR
jgi:hypothetical protein